MANMITSELDHAVHALEERGFDVIYKPTAWDDNSFYRIVSHVKWKSFEHPNAARSRIGKVQTEKDHQLFFLAFEPECDQHNNGNINLVTILKTDLNDSKGSRAIPTRRDMYAAAEFLQQSIHMIYWDPSSVKKEVIDPPLTPYSTDDITYILSVSHQNKTAYVQLTPGEGATTVELVEHSQCQGLAFRRSVKYQLHVPEKTNADLIDDKWIVDQSVTSDEIQCFFYSVSKAMYGTEVYHEYVRELIVKCLREDVLAEVFFESTNDDEVRENVTPKEKEKRKKQKREHYIDLLQKGETTPGHPELYAAAYLYRTQIFEKRKDRTGWDVYLPLSLPRNTRPRLSYITLNDLHRLLVPQKEECNCLLEKPPVEYLESINSKTLESMAFHFVVKDRLAICCPGERHGSHKHLDEFCKMKKEKTEYTHHCAALPDGVVIDGRTLDKVTYNRATFQQCIHKLIYGIDEVSDDFEVREEAPDDEYLLHTARWLKKRIYVYSSLSQSWKIYRPDEEASSMDGPVPKCRYYITLFHCDDRYDIITPTEGCNCIMRPPEAETSQTDTRQFIRKKDRHNPLTEFFLDDSISDSFTDETQSLLSKEGYSQVCEVFHRPDMEHRDVDKGQAVHSLYTCLSKEIFGNEEEAGRIEELIAKEMLENAEMYVSLLGVKSQLKRSSLSLQSEVDKTLVPFFLLFGHLRLFAAATVFQTPIYVLQVEPSEEKHWKSSWASFTQVRRKKAPASMPKSQSKCRQDGNSDRYCVTLLQDPHGNFFRIVQKREKVCNCQLVEPGVPGEFVSVPLKQEDIRSRSIASQRPLGWEVAEHDIIQTFRELDNSLGRNLQNIRQMMSLVSTQLLMYDLIVAVFESRRRNINIASISGSSVSAVGAALLILGFVLAPATAGATLGLSVAGGVISGVGSVSVIGSKVTEGALTKHQLRGLIVIHELLDILSKESAQSNRAFMEIAQKVMTYVEGDVGEIGGNTSGIAAGMSPALGRFMGSFHLVPVIIARLTAQVSSMIVGSVVGVSRWS